MFVPNLYTSRQASGIYGLHRFKDGVVMLAKQHSSGDWVTIAPVTPEQSRYFEEYGMRVEKEKN